MLPRLLVILALGALLAGCIERETEPVRVIVDGTVVATGLEPRTIAADGTARPAGDLAPLPYRPTPPPSTLDPADLRGFVMPFEGGCLPSRDVMMPNAPRPYRNGVNEAIDFYDGDVCAGVQHGTPVRAMYDGVVIRADHDYENITAVQIEERARRVAETGYANEETLDSYRGRQVWIDHGNGIVSRYAHLDAVSMAVDVGVEVRAGQVIGAAGESGTVESVTAPGSEVHVHVEVRVDDGFLGRDLPPAEVRRIYERLFSGEAP